MTVLSVDLASRRYRDNGIAIVSNAPNGIRAQLFDGVGLGLEGVPIVDEFADVLTRLAVRHAARLILLDGPQGWRSTNSQNEHQRSCERLTRTPGKTGLPGTVKPNSWTRMVKFSIAMFDALEARGWPRLARDWAGGLASSESFPTHAWRTIGFHPLPSKRKKFGSMNPWIALMQARHRVQFSRPPTHDELQAVVAGIAGIQMLEGGLAACECYGENPRMEEGDWREGLIVCPR